MGQCFYSTQINNIDWMPNIWVWWMVNWIWRQFNLSLNNFDWSTWSFIRIEIKFGISHGKITCTNNRQHKISFTKMWCFFLACKSQSFHVTIFQSKCKFDDGAFRMWLKTTPNHFEHVNSFLLFLPIDFILSSIHKVSSLLFFFIAILLKRFSFPIYQTGVKLGRADA